MPCFHGHQIAQRNTNRDGRESLCLLLKLLGYRVTVAQDGHEGVEKALTCQPDVGLIDIGLRYGGSYYPTYHRHATRAQVEACFPQMREFLALKRKHDPDELFQSDWYRHYRGMFGA